MLWCGDIVKYMENLRKKAMRSTYQGSETSKALGTDISLGTQFASRTSDMYVHCMCIMHLWKH